jgi:CHAT domain-containing protein
VRGGRIESVARGSGDAGRIAIESPRVRLDRGARITASTEAGGTGGRITVDGVERFRMADGSAIEATSLAAPGPDDPGDAGAIRIDGAPASDFVVADSRIETTAVGSGGGFIGMGANDATLLLDDAAIRTDVLSGDRQAGTIVIRGQTLVTRGGEIVARAAEGQGGAIEILVSDFRPGDDTLIASTSDAGFDGPVRVRSPETLVATNRVIPLEPEFLDPIDLLRRDCQAPGDPGAGGSFTVGANRGRADAMPVAWAPAAGAPPAEAAVETSMPWRHALAARAAADAGRRSEALAQLASLAEETEALDDARERVRLAIHAAGTWAALAQESSGERAASDLLRAHDALRDAARLAAASDDERGRALALGHLAELYRREARFDEALFLARRAEAAAERSDRDPNRYRWSWLQGRIEWERGHTGEAIAAFGRAVAVLERESPQARRFRRDVAPLYLDWVDALLHSAARVQDPDARARLLLRARDSMERLKVAELRDYYRDECVADLKAKTLPLDAVSERAAIVYPVPLRDRLELLVSVGGHIERYATPVTSDEVVATALRFRQGVENRLSVEYIETGKVLYDWFVRPYAEALRARGVDTLVFVPDGIVGAIPFAALRGDGGVLIDQFAVAVTPGLSLVDPRPLPHERLEPLLVGLSQPAEGLPALASVAGELGDIHALHGGEVLLDEDFERARLAREVASQRPAVLHIASHAVFTGDPATSFVLAHDGRIPLESLAAVVGQNRFRDDPVELLILSACETAAGDQHAALGLAGMAVRAGARSAVGSLWSIDDAAAREFVVEFYRQLLVPDVGRAEALRRAQLRLRSDERYTHPYYWSAFLMISDWQ